MVYGVICEESVKEGGGGQHAILWGTSIQEERFGERVVDFDRLRHMKNNVENPVTDGRMHIQQGKFTEQLQGEDGVEC